VTHGHSHAANDERSGSHGSLIRLDVGDLPAASPRVGGLAPSDVIMRVLSTSKGLPTMEPKAPASDPAVNYQ
jgi:hypothetical protein